MVPALPAAGLDSGDGLLVLDDLQLNIWEWSPGDPDSSWMDRMLQPHDPLPDPDLE